MSTPMVAPALSSPALVGIDAEFAEDGAGFDAGFGVVAGLGLGNAGRLAAAEGDLDGGVPVGLGRLDLA